MSVEEKRIREFAYQIWESEGKPEGHEARHWEMARKLAEAEALAPQTSPGKKTRAAAKPKTEQPPGNKAAAKSAAKSEPAKKPRAPKKPAPL